MLAVSRIAPVEKPAIWNKLTLEFVGFGEGLRGKGNLSPFIPPKIGD